MREVGVPRQDLDPREEYGHCYAWVLTGECTSRCMHLPRYIIFLLTLDRYCLLYLCTTILYFQSLLVTHGVLFKLKQCDENISHAHVLPGFFPVMPRVMLELENKH